MRDVPDALLALPFGILIGLLLGLLGGGGSILAVPVLVYVLGEPPASATTESLVVVGSAALVGASSYARSRQIEVRTSLVFSVAGAVGTVPGTAVNRVIGDEALLLGFAAVLAAAAVALLRSRPERAPRAAHSRAVAVSAGLVTGVLTGLFGVGGGFLIVPALTTLLGLPMRTAVGTSLLVIALTGGAALVGHLATGTIDWPLALAFAGAAIAGAVAGRRISNLVPARTLRHVFALLLLAVAVSLLVENVTSLAT